MQFDINILGFVAAACTTCAFIPQVLMLWRDRSAPGVSTGMYLIFCSGVFLWLCYGVIIHAWPLAINNGITLLLASSVLVMKWRFERSAEKKSDTTNS